MEGALACPQNFKELIIWHWQIDDGTGTTKSRLVIWNKPGSDVSGLIARSEKVVKTTEKVCIEVLDIDRWTNQFSIAAV